WRWKLKWLARFLAHIARGLTGIEIHPGAKIGRRFFIDHGMGVVIGETAEVGDNVTLYHGVTLGGTSWNEGKRHPSLGNGVVVGAGAKVLGPVYIGDDAKIGSNAVVTRDVPAGATAVGIPARILDEDYAKAKGEKEHMSRMTFSAYAVGTNQDDPLARAIHGLLDHAEETDRRLALLLEHLREKGVNVEDVAKPRDDFDLDYLSKIVD
ncbi:MAG: serine O-acetyltransferase, partial [Zoogloeaceae bacterium]|nr:serine O-acetyltransferase [Zoogloeaceae bacterium]